MQTATRAGLGFRAGVKDYRLTYFMDDYKVLDTDLLAGFRLGMKPGVPRSPLLLLKAPGLQSGRMD